MNHCYGYDAVHWANRIVRKEEDDVHSIYIDIEVEELNAQDIDPFFIHCDKVRKACLSRQQRERSRA